MIDDKQIDLLLKHFSEIDPSVEMASWINPSLAVELITRLRQAEKDAARYRFLRGFHWSESPMCVVTDPSSAIKLGSNCPSREMLDAAIDEAMQCK